MKDIASKRAKREGARSAPSERTLMLAEVVRDNLFAFVVREGMKALDVLLERDREALCGPAYARDATASAMRWGSTKGKLVMGGQRVSVRRPRVRQDGREVGLPAWSQFADRLHEGGARPAAEAIAAAIRPTLSRHFKPALLARMTIVPFAPMSQEILRQIVNLKLGKLKSRIWDAHRAETVFSPELADDLARRCSESETGARNIDHVLRGGLMPLLSRESRSARYAWGSRKRAFSST